MRVIKATRKISRKLGKTIRKNPGKTALVVGGTALAAAGTIAAARMIRNRRR